MMHIFDSFQGCLTVEITNAAPEILLHKLNQNGISMRNVQYLNALTVSFEIKRRDYGKLRQIAEKSGSSTKTLKSNGIYWNVKRLLFRPVLLSGIIGLILLTLFLPTRILFVDIKGNERLSTSLILEKAELCGINFGASRRNVRSEATKNKLLSLLSELRWAGVNTYGCVAQITVQEKSDLQEGAVADKIRHVVAAKDGIISELTIFQGSAQCKVGQAVAKGQILVSGYINHGISLEATCADAEIMGYTGNVLSTVTPIERLVRDGRAGRETKYQLLLGKKLINLGKDSGISDVKCVRMYEERYLTLPGGFRLPVALVLEQSIPYALHTKCVEDPGDYAWVKTAAEDYLQSQMLSGEILHSNTLEGIDDGLYTLYGTYQCREIIGRIRSEEKLITDE